jgi:RNA polymerase sigma-70 factor (ECF subfamily)
VSRPVPSLACPEALGAELVRSPPSLESVYREHFKAVWRVLRRLGVAAAQLDDAAQDVFLVVHRKLAGVDASGPLRSWIFAISVRVASDYRRRSGRRRTEPLDDGFADAAPGPARQTELSEELRMLEELLAELDEKKREVFVLAELEQLSVPEIAVALEVNTNTVYSRLRSARQHFDAALARRRAASRRLSP